MGDSLKGIFTTVSDKLGEAVKGAGGEGGEGGEGEGT